MVTNLSTSQYLITGATTSGAASESTSSASTGMRPAAAGSQPDILFLTRANGRQSQCSWLQLTASGP
jgi:hypothetical protein